MKRVLCTALAVFAACSVHAQEPSESQSDPKFMISASFNYAMRVAKNPPGLTSTLNDYVKELKSGISYDIAAYYMIKESWGLGFKYNVYRSENSIGTPIQVIAPNLEVGISPISDDITISFYALSFLINEEFAENHHGRVDIGAGYMDYTNKAFAIDDYKFKGGTFGVSTALGYQYEPFDNFSFGPQLSIFAGTISKFKVTSSNGYNETVKLDKDFRESLFRIDVGLTAKYTF